MSFLYFRTRKSTMGGGPLGVGVCQRREIVDVKIDY